MTFGKRFRAALDDRGPLCVGVDPHASLLRDWGLSDDANGLETFALTVVEALADRAAVMKPQSAFFERHGSKGIAVLEKVLAGIRDGGALALLDAKRGDIGSTVQAYADAYLRPSSPLFADAITASPYLGFGSLEPLFEAAHVNDCGVFVLALTSNPEGPDVQQARAEGRTVGGIILDNLAARNAGADPLGSLGAVVAANLPVTPEEDFGRMNGPILAPGFGAQGGAVADLQRIFGAALPNVTVSSSREVLAAGPTVDRLREAAKRSADSLS